jgi:CheY-like chemotaxis protein
MMLVETTKRKSVGNRNRERCIRILMIDDHPSQIEGYKVILSYNNLSLDIEATPCYSCEDAYRIINSGTDCFDLIFLDENMPAYLEKNIQTGMDLANVINRKMPKSKIVIITSHSQAFLLYNIAKKIDPAGILVKSDFKAEELLSKETYLDSFNRQIITLLSKGIRTKNMPDYLHLSLSAIEKRKAQVKDYFCLEKGTDEDIVREARHRGFI